MSRASMIVGEYPCWIEDRPDETVVHFEPKRAGSSSHTFFNLRFRVTDPAKRSRIKAVFDELSSMG